MKSNKFILVLGIILLAMLAVKSLKQFVYLSFTLLSLKIVWVGIILFVFFTYIKKAFTAPEDKK
jgi:hypothetical protein